MPSPRKSIPRRRSSLRDGLPVPRRYWSIAAILLAIIMSVLDSTIVNVALPSMPRDLHVAPAASVWVVNAYQMAILMALLPLASLGEIVGYRRVSQAGIIVFTLASLACALAPSLLTLSIARVVQGLGAAGIMSVNAALVRFTYPQASLGRAMGINAFVIATAAAIGPTIASAVLAVAHWRWLFGINVPIGIIATLIALRRCPNPTASPAAQLRRGGLVCGHLRAQLSGLQSLAHHEALPLALRRLALGVRSAGCWCGTSCRAPAPIIPFRPAARADLHPVACHLGLSFMAQMTALVSLPFEIQRLGYSAVETGLFMTPWPLALAFAAPFAGRLLTATRRGSWADWAARHGERTAAPGLLPRRARPGRVHLAHGAVRTGVRVLPGSQQPHHHGGRPAAAQRRRGRNAQYRAAARPDPGSGLVAILFRAYAASGPQVALWIAAALALAGAAVSLVRMKGLQAA